MTTKIPLLKRLVGKYDVVPLRASAESNQSIISQEYESTKSALRNQAEITVSIVREIDSLMEFVNKIQNNEELKRQLRNKILDIRDTGDRLLNRTSILFDSYERLGSTIF